LLRHLHNKLYKFKWIKHMSKLTDDSLEFAKEHIKKYYDSDFFPKQFEFNAIWHNWAEVKSDLTSKNIEKMWVFPPKSFPAVKANGTYRIVHQLEPIDSIIYTALAYLIADSVENARIPAQEKIACSYRLDIKEGSFFSDGGGYPDFDTKTSELSEKYKYILVTDITDFYNQIYLHRLNNAIEHSDSSLKNIAKDIESFLSKINGKTSQGIPVGPAASVVMSEALMTDIDQHLQSFGAPFVRYVDDIRIFSNDLEQLDSILRELTLYLYENHRLTLSSGKTHRMEAKKYVEEYLHNPYDLEKAEIFESLEIYNPYTGELVAYEEVEVELDEDEAAEHAFIAALDKAISQKSLDVGLAKGIIRRARSMNSGVLVDQLLSNFTFFLPVVSDVMIYVSQITDDTNINSIQHHIEKISASTAMNNPLASYWLEWYIARSSILLKGTNAINLINVSKNIEHQALAAITGNNLAWVRSMKTQIYNTSSKGRRAILYATKILPSDERTHWLRMTIGSTQFIIDKWVATWVLDTA